MKISWNTRTKRIVAITAAMAVVVTGGIMYNDYASAKAIERCEAARRAYYDVTEVTKDTESKAKSVMVAKEGFTGTGDLEKLLSDEKPSFSCDVVDKVEKSIKTQEARNVLLVEKTASTKAGFEKWREEYWRAAFLDSRERARAAIPPAEPVMEKAVKFTIRERYGMAKFLDYCKSEVQKEPSTAWEDNRGELDFFNDCAKSVTEWSNPEGDVQKSIRAAEKQAAETAALNKALCVAFGCQKEKKIDTVTKEAQ